MFSWFQDVLYSWLALTDYNNVLSSSLVLSVVTHLQIFTFFSSLLLLSMWEFFASEHVYKYMRVRAAVVLQAGVCGVRDSSGGRGRWLGSVVALGGVQQDMWRRSVLFYQTL